MAIRFTRFCGRATLIAIEALAVVVGLLALCLGLLIWRVNSGPLDVTFARDYVQEAMRDPVTGYSLNVGHATISWPDLKGPVLLRLLNTDLRKHGREVLHVGMIDLSLSKAQLLLGQVAPQGVILTNSSLRLMRTVNDKIVLSLEDEVADVTVEQAAENSEDNALMNAVKSLAQPEGLLDKRSPFDRLKTIEIKNARMVMEDHARGITWFMPDVDFVFLRDREGLILTASMEMPSDPSAPARVTADISYNRERDDVAVNLDLQNVDPQVIAGKFPALDFLAPHNLAVTGEAMALLDGNLRVLDVEIDISAGAGTLVLPDAYKEPFAFEAINFNGKYDRAAGQLSVRNLSIAAQGVTVAATAKLAATEEKIDGPVNIVITELPQEKIAALWPDSAREDSAADWLINRITGGTYTNIKAGFSLKGGRSEALGGDWDLSVEDITGDLAMTGMKVEYREPLPAATGVSAKGRYEKDNLVITIDKGAVGGLKVDKGTVALTDLIYGTPGGVKIGVDLAGPVGAVFDYIKNEPIGMDGARLGIDAAGARGNAALHVDVAFPALKDLPAEKVIVGVQGTLTDTLVPNVVKTMSLTGGPFALTVDRDMVKMTGKGKLDGRDVDFAWSQYLESAGKPFSGRVEASMMCDTAFREKMGVKIADWVDGTMPVKVIYTEFGAGRAEIDVTADTTPAVVMVKPFKYEKPAGAKGSARALVKMQGAVLQEIQRLGVQTPDLNLENGRLTFAPQGADVIVRQGTFPRMTLGENDFALNLETLPNGAMKLAVSGAVFDARPFLKNDRKPGDPPPPPYAGPAILASIDAARMRTHPGRMMEAAKVYLDMAANGDINRLDVDATAGAGAVNVRLRPDATGKMSLRLEAADAGAAMSAFGVYENVRGGKLVIVGEAANPATPRVLFGNVELTGFKAVNAPILARLVGALSPMGLAELLASDGLYFERLESKFTWHMRREGDLYVLTDGRTSGSSIGLTFAGNIDKASQQVDINGNVVPMSMINDLISAIPIIGTLLSGGSDGGVFAATYTITGAQTAPVVSVNPLSVLAPGIIRRILFEEN
jgi:hypothetical protein